MTLQHKVAQFVRTLRPISPGSNLRRTINRWQQAAVGSSLQMLEDRCLLSAISVNLFNDVNINSVGVGPSPRTMAINDYDGDNIADMAVANAGDGTVSVLRGFGDGSFGQETRYTLPSYAYGLVAADFDGDHQIDLMTSNTGAHDISFLKGNGDGTFQSQLVVGDTAGQEGNRLIAADFNGDGRLDLAAPTWNGYVAVLMGNGNGSFGATSLYYSGGLVNCSDIVTGDFNGDHKLDLATANVYGQGVSIFSGNGDGTFFVSASYSLGGYTGSLVSGDFDHDGHLDIAAPSYNLNRVGVLRGNADGSFSAPSYYSVAATPFYIEAADFNGDDNLDLVVAAYSSDAVSVLGGNGDGSFQPAVNFAAGVNPLGVEVSDFDGNGTIDVVVSNLNSDTLSVLLNLSDPPNTAPGFTTGPDIVVEEGATPQSFTTWATGISAGPPNESQQQVTFTVTANSNPTLFTSALQITADGTLTFQAAPGASGIAIITVQLTDDGGTENGGADTSPPQSFQIIVLPFVIDIDPTTNAVPENAGLGTAVGISAFAGLLSPFNFVSHLLENNDGKPFAIDATTGVITVAGPLDFETNSSYSIDVVSSRTDSSTLSFVSKATFVVSILDVPEGIIIPGGPGNDTFKFWPGPAAGQFYLKRNTEPNVLITPADSVTIVGGGGTDTLIIEGTNGANEFEIHLNRIQFNGIDFFDNQITTRQINALGSGDTISVYDGPATVNGGSASDTLVAMASSNHVWSLNGPNWGNLDGEVFFSNMERMLGGPLDDVFHFGSTGSVGSVIDGGSGSDSLDYSDVTTPVSINLQSGAATRTGGISNMEQFLGGSNTDTLTGSNTVNLWTLDGIGTGNVNGTHGFSGFENLTGGNQADTFVVQPAGSASGTVSGGDGVDVLDYTQYGSSMTIDLSVANGTGISHFTSIATIHGSAESDSIVGANNGNTWTVTATGGTVDGITFDSIEKWSGGTATDTLVGQDVETAWLVTGANSGSVYGVSFLGMENLTGKTQIDSFAIQGGGSISGVINGGAGVDVLDFSAASGAVTVNLANNSASTVGTFSSIGVLLGSAWNDILIGNNNSNIWAIMSPTTGTVATYSFSRFESLLGGTGNDTFRVAEGVSYPGSVDGGAGIDKLDYAAFDSAVNANLATGIATGFNGVTNVENLTGGDGNDTLVGNGTDNVILGGNGDDIVCGLAGNDLLSGNNGRDLLIGGTGSDTVHGNNTEDILLGGTMIYTEESTGVMNQVALDALMLEWRRKDATYAQRVAHLNGSNSGGLNGGYLLTALTVLDDLTIDDLYGDGGLDWCLFGTGDVVHS